MATLISGLTHNDDVLGIHSATTAAEFIDGLYADLFGRQGDASGRDYWIGAVENGMSRERIAANFIDSGEYRAITASTIGSMFVADHSAQMLMTLYHVMGRMPDQGGFDHWMAELNSGTMTIEQITDAFGHSEEWSARTSGLTDVELIDQLVQVTLERQADGSEHDYWTAAIDNGLTRNEMLSAFAWSDEHQLFMLDYLRAGVVNGGI